MRGRGRSSRRAALLGRPRFQTTGPDVLFVCLITNTGDATYEYKIRSITPKVQLKQWPVDIIIIIIIRNAKQKGTFQTGNGRFPLADTDVERLFVGRFFFKFLRDCFLNGEDIERYVVLRVPVEHFGVFKFIRGELLNPRTRLYLRKTR